MDGEEGRTFLGSDSYSADDALSLRLVNLGSAQAIDIRSGDRILGTATDGANNTSEFSRATVVGSRVTGRWETLLGPTSFLYDIAAVDANHAWAVGGLGAILSTSDGGATWTSQLADAGTPSSLYGVDFVNAATGWVVGESGAVLKTSDGGATWVPQISGVTGALYIVDFVDSNTGWAVGSRGTVLKTTDGGATWSSQATPVSFSLYGVSFIDGNIGWAVGNRGTIIKTTDGGATWFAQASGVEEPLFGLSFVNAATGWAVGYSGAILKTADGGATWTAQASGTTEDLRGVDFIDSLVGWAVGRGEVLKTVDGGLTWQSTASDRVLLSVEFLSPSTGWATGVGETILRTDDGGATWTATRQAASSGGTLYDLSFANSQEGWAVGSEGTILRAIKGDTWRVQASGTTNTLFGIDFISSSTGWAVGASGTVLKASVDKGQGGKEPRAAGGDPTWTAQSSTVAHSLNAVQFVDSGTGWIVGMGGTILKIDDGGATWTPQTSGVTVSLYGVHFVDGTTGWVVGSAGTILMTGDGGANWNAQTSRTYDTLLGVGFSGSNNGWAVGGDGTILHTVDGGASWVQEPNRTPDLHPLRSVVVLDATTAFVSGAPGLLLAFEPPSADLSVTKIDASDLVVAGTELVYTLMVFNNGPGTSSGAVLTDELPSGLSFVSAVPTQGNCEEASGTVTCSIDVLEPGGTVTIALRTNVAPSTVGVISNITTASGREQDPNPSNNTASESTTVIAPSTVASVGSISIAEGASGAKTTANILVTLSVAIPLPVDVQFHTSPDTAHQADGDYVSVSQGAITIPAGATSRTIPVDILGDSKFEGDELFTVTLTSADLAGTSISFAITQPTTAVTILNDDPPATANDAYATDEDQQVIVSAAAGLLANDTAPVPGVTFRAVMVTFPASGALLLNPDGSIDYTPDSDFTGVDSFTYLLNDGRFDSNIATVTITVAAINDTPAVAAPLADVVVNEDAPDTVIDLSGTFEDADGDALTLSVQANTDLALVSASLVGTALTLPYAANRNGEADVILRATDAAGLSVDETIRVTVRQVNDAPVVTNPLPRVTVAEDAPDTVLDISSLFGDVDITTDGDVLTLDVVGTTNPGLVSASLSGANASVVGSILTLGYIAGQHGTSTITLRATDKAGATVETTLEIAVAAVNDPPKASNVAFVVPQNRGTTTLDIMANDTTTPDVEETLTVTSVSSGSAGGRVLVSGEGSTVDYRPAEGFVGTEMFTYTVNDGTPGSDDTATVTIYVTGPGLSTAVVPVTTGFNLIGTPMDFGTTTTAGDLAQMVAAQGGEVASILSWSAGFEAWIADFPGEKDFVIEPGRGYFLRLVAPPVNNSLILPGARRRWSDSSDDPRPDSSASSAPSAVNAPAWMTQNGTQRSRFLSERSPTVPSAPRPSFPKPPHPFYSSLPQQPQDRML